PCSHTLFFFKYSPPTQTHTLSLHALFRSWPGWTGAHDAAAPAVATRATRAGSRGCPPPRTPGARSGNTRPGRRPARSPGRRRTRSEEHTSELQSRFDLVCRLLLEKKKSSA